MSRELKIHCDKCKKEIEITNEYVAHAKIGEVYEFDFCGKCYEAFIRTVGSWLKGKE